MPPKTAGDYWKENVRWTFSVWEKKESMITFLLYLATLGIYFGVLRDSPGGILPTILAIISVAWLPVVALVVTPRKMWVKSQATISEYEERFKPRLNIELDEGSVEHETHPDGSVESWVRLKIANCSDGALQGIAVTIEECTPKLKLPIPFELSDAYCNQPPLPIPARDRRYVELVRSAGDALHLRMYASSDVSIPRNEYVFKVRASTRSYPCRDEKTIKVNVDDDGKLSCRFLEPGG